MGNGPLFYLSDRGELMEYWSLQRIRLPLHQTIFNRIFASLYKGLIGFCIIFLLGSSYEACESVTLLDSFHCDIFLKGNHTD